MKSVNIQLSDFEYAQLGLKSNILSFSELIEIVGRKINKQALERSVQLAQKYRLSSLSMKEINEEITALRNAKDNS